MSRTELEELMRSEVNALEVLALFELIFRDDVRFRVIRTLANREGANLREIARNVGLSHKNLSKYLEKLIQKGVVTAFPVGLRNRVYKLSAKYEFLRVVL